MISTSSRNLSLSPTTNKAPMVVPSREYNLHDIRRKSQGDLRKLQAEECDSSILRQITNCSIVSAVMHAKDNFSDSFSDSGSCVMDADIDEIVHLCQEGKQRLRRGRYNEALAFLSRALLLQREALGPKHRDVGATLNNIGIAYKYMGPAYEYKALSALEEALVIFQLALGPRHDTTRKTTDSLWKLLRNIRERHEAEGEYVSRNLVLQKSAAYAA